MDIIINGYSGQMGQTIKNLISQNDDINLVGRIDRVGGLTNDGNKIFENIKDFDGKGDVIIDFSTPSSLDNLLEYAKETNTALVIATTGLTDEQVKKIDEYSKYTRIFRSANMSLGINVLLDLVSKAAKVLDKFDIEIIEKHHNLKIDSPSGTAFMIADKINSEYDNNRDFIYGRHSKTERRDKKEIGIHAVRGGTIVGEHDVIFAGTDEILEINHIASSKKVFAEGAIAAARFLMTRENGLYNMDDLIKSV